MKKRKQFFVLGIAALAALLLNPVQAAASNSLLKTDSSDKASFQKGTLKGKVMFSETMEPLAGVSVALTSNQEGTVTDKDGIFVFPDIPTGNYTLTFTLPGFDKLAKTDIIVRPERITFVEAELKMSSIETENVVVTASYFSQDEKQSTSSTGYSAEEVRRTPSLLSDINRTIKGLPSVANINHQWNGLVVRGGNPLENGYFTDNIEIPNINHYPVQGSSEGFVSLLNVDFIENAIFQAGGFSALYGNYLSSVTDISLRDGNREELDMQLDFNFAGIGGTIEGPINKGKGSWMFSARGSFTGFVANLIDSGSSDIPEYNDSLAKIVYELSPSHKLSFLRLYGADNWAWTRQDALADGDNWYGDVRISQSIEGINWRSTWGSKGYSDTSFSHLLLKNNWNFDLTASSEKFMLKNSKEEEFRLRNVNHFHINPNHKMEFGFEAKLLKSNFDDSFSGYADFFGNPTPQFDISNESNSYKYGTFFNHTWKPLKNLTFVSGLYVGHFTYSKNTYFSPRFSFSLQLNPKTSLNGSTGIYHQNLPMVLLAQKEEFKDLDIPRAVHYVLGIRHFFTDDTRLTFEIYHKEYSRFPLDPSQPTFFIMDEATYRYFFYNHEQLVSTGRGWSRGVEFMIQKKLTNKLYGLAGGSWFQSRYRDFEGVWRNRIYDSRYNITLEAGYKPNYKWGFSFRWMVGGGTPYTPYDLAASMNLGRGVLDVNNTNSQRLPGYNYLSLRIDRRFHFKRSALIMFASVWNVFNNKGVDGYTWLEASNSLGEGEGFPRIPIIGLEFEF